MILIYCFLNYKFKETVRSGRPFYVTTSGEDYNSILD